MSPCNQPLLKIVNTDVGQSAVPVKKKFKPLFKSISPKLGASGAQLAPTLPPAATAEGANADDLSEDIPYSDPCCACKKHSP